MSKDILILILTALCMAQAGYLLNEYIQFKYGPVPLATTQDIINITEGE